MTPADLQQLLIERVLGIPGITGAGKRDDDRPYGLTVALEGGGQVWRTITGASGPAPTITTGYSDGAESVEVPDLTGSSVPVALVEQALVAVAVAAVAADDAAGGIVRADRYSTRPDPPAVRYGATLECRDGWKLFLSCYGTARPGHTRPEQPYQPLSHI